ncbi:hypothetical protein PGTUg99_011054 [Puccinia graminis f. sp. tritici]|uniref:Uncharacterized protein n=1 Tax=Puccinia graminis f. sp. tritici TaxID=56615 RepID=A0A5B0RUG0_PUCGR|nr:hypothetical protein PGTUg99_011054 [Puccinia graminis f. sp. tritici]
MLEAKYYLEQEEEESNKEEEFAINIQDPTYILALENLKLAKIIFSKLLEDIDETAKLKDGLKSKLKTPPLLFFQICKTGEDMGS